MSSGYGSTYDAKCERECDATGINYEMVNRIMSKIDADLEALIMVARDGYKFAKHNAQRVLRGLEPLGQPTEFCYSNIAVGDHPLSVAWRRGVQYFNDLKRVKQ